MWWPTGPVYGAVALKLAADHEKVAPHGLRLLGALFTLLDGQAPPGSQLSQEAASWLPRAQQAIAEGTQSRSMKVGSKPFSLAKYVYGE